MTETVATLEGFLADKCEATKAKYAAELANAREGWVSALDFAYAEALVYFGLLERRVETIYSDSGRHIRGSRCWFRKSHKTEPQGEISEQFQTDLFAERFA